VKVEIPTKSLHRSEGDSKKKSRSLKNYLEKELNKIKIKKITQK
jgi:hypothetical protein